MATETTTDLAGATGPAIGPAHGRESPSASDLPGRIRHALAHRDRAELALLNPIILALAKSEVSLAEIEPLDAEQALWLVAARAEERGEKGTRAFVKRLG